MNVAFFISKKLALSRGTSFSRFIIRVATVAVALSVAVMIVAGAIVKGFQKEISEKVFGFWGHISIRSYELSQAYGEEPIRIQQPFYPGVVNLPGIRHIQATATKAGIIKSDEAIEGVVLRGVGKDFDWNFLNRYLVEGKSFYGGDSASRSNILISQTTAERLRLNLGDEVIVYFIQEPMRFRKLAITGIYKTGLEEYDRLYALVDLGLIQRLNGWTEEEAGAFEVFVDEVKQLESLGAYLNSEIVGQELQAKTLRQVNPNLFDWLDLQTMNERVIILLMILVAVINMTTLLLILILERTNMIGVMKALGSSNWTIRKIFLFHALWIAGLGLLMGNVIGLGLCILQEKFQLIRLDEASYYVSVAPVLVDPVFVLLVNAGTLAVCLLTLLIPSYLVSQITPVKALRFN
jgi:lipoprotein-releasing system permease protein